MNKVKKSDVIIREYVKKLSDDDLKQLGARLSQRLGGDVGDVVEILEKNPEVNRWLGTAQTAWEFYDMIDQAEVNAQQEIRRRIVNEPKETKRW